MDIEVHRCLTALTSINYTSPIGLDCTSFTNKLLLQDEGDKIPKKKYIYTHTHTHTYDQSVGNKNFQQNLLRQIQRKFFYFDIKMILSIENNH